MVSADDVCAAAELVLRQHLPELTRHLGVDQEYGEILEWQQLPTVEALSAAELPAIAITSPGLTGSPTRDGRGEHRATWRLAVGIYDRGDGHRDTQARVRNWCAYIRTTLVSHRALGDLKAESLTWVGEEYRLAPQRGQARTFGGGAVAFDITIPNVVDLGSPWPVVTSTNPDLTVR